MPDTIRITTDTEGWTDSLDGHSILRVEAMPAELGEGATIQASLCSVYSYGAPKEPRPTFNDADLFIITMALFFVILGALLWKAGK